MYCETPEFEARRRAKSLQIQGIDYVDVLDLTAPSEVLRHRILLVRCFQSVAGLSKQNINITASQEAPPLSVVWAFAADTIPAVPDGELVLQLDNGATEVLLPGHKQYFADLADSDRVLVVHITHTVSPAENMTQYRLSVTFYPGTDPRLTAYDFTLHAEGEIDIDCVARAPSLERRLISPPLDYLAKDYASFRRLMLDRVAVVMPEWKDRNVADIGVAMIEVLAYIGDQLSYYQDAVATEAYLGSARRRISIRRHARLLDYSLHEGNNARVWVCLEVGEGFQNLLQSGNLGEGVKPIPGIKPLKNKSGGGGGGHSSGEVPLPGENPSSFNLIPTGTVLITKLKNEEKPSLSSKIIGEAVLQGAVFFETMVPILPHPLRNSISLYDWGGTINCLHKGSAQATLRIPYEMIGKILTVGDVVVIESIDDALNLDPSTDCDKGRNADTSLRHAVCLTSIKPVADLMQSDEGGAPIQLTEIQWHDKDAMPFSLLLRHASGAAAAHVRGNVVLADHGRTIQYEPMIPDMPSSDEQYCPRLARTDLTHSTPIVFEEWRKLPASQQLLQDVRQAIPSAEILEKPFESGDALTWSPRRDLLASGAFDRHVAIEIENDHTAHVRFGDNMYGRRPSIHSKQWSATYRVGNGAAGNIGADAIAHLVIPEVSQETKDLLATGLLKVYNPLPAVGGHEPERDEQARLYAPYAFRVGERAVTSDDYAKIVERHPEVQKAVAIIRWTGSWNTVFVTVDRQGGRPLDLEFEAELRTFLEPFRMAGQDLEFQPPYFVALDIAFTVHVEPEHLQSEVRMALMDSLGSGQGADGRIGFFHPDNFTFGEPVYLSRLVARAMEVPGVAWLDVDDKSPKPNRFQRMGESPRGELEEGMITVGPLQIIRVDNDPLAPHNGRLRLYMKGGL